MAIKFKINEDENEAKEREQKLQQEENEKVENHKIWQKTESEKLQSKNGQTLF